MSRVNHKAIRCHKVLNRLVWSPRDAARNLIVLLRHLDRGDGPLIFGVRSSTNQETLELRRGDKIRPEASTRARSAPVATNWSRPVVCAGPR